MNLEITSSAVAIFSSHVMRGSVGNRAAVFALEQLGVCVWAIPTIVMPWHPGHAPSTRLTFDEKPFGAAIDELTDNAWSHELKGALTGYFANVSQVEAAARFITRCKKKNTAFQYVCDPVIGDNGQLYVGEHIAEAIKEKLLPLADLVTPNRFELSFLAGQSCKDNAQITQAARTLQRPAIAVTSAYAMTKNSTAVLLVAKGTPLLAEHRMVDHAPNGLGDLFSALMLAHMTHHQTFEESLQRATRSLCAYATAATANGLDRLPLAEYPHLITKPPENVALRHLVF